MDTPIESKLLLWCLLCNERFSPAEVTVGIYYPETGICKGCYEKLVKDDRTCFGKEEFYDQKTLECGQYCPDRKICPEFIAVSKRQRT